MTLKEQLTRSVTVVVLTVLVSRTLDFGIHMVRNRFFARD